MIDITYKTHAEVKAPSQNTKDKLGRIAQALKGVNPDFDPHDSSFSITTDELFKINNIFFPVNLPQLKEFVYNLVVQIETDKFEGHLTVK
jgi:hypothetical protein